MTSSTDQLIREGHKAIKQGEKAEARRLLQEAAKKNPADFRAWLGLAAVARTPQESIIFIDKATELKPDNPGVQHARQWAEKQLASQSPRQVEVKAKPAPTSLPVRQTAEISPNNPPPVAPLPLPPVTQDPAYRLGLTVRRVLGGAAVLGLVIIMGLVAWVAYNAYLESSGLATSSDPTPEATPTQVAIALVPEAQVSNILPEEAPEVESVVENTPTPNPLQPKNIIQSDSDPRPRWTTTPLPTETPTPSPTWAPTFVAPLSEADILKPIGLLPSERWIDVALSTQSLIAYEGDLPVFETLVSSGLPAHPTVTGQFRIWLRFESQTMDGTRLGYNYYLEDVPYVQYFFEDYALHGTYWHNNFGHPMSHGCVNLSTPDAEWLYNFADYGTVVYIHQ